jgi:(R,R)-butanediol dehydrogenase / meso-butanediol dehydrogenase / diacetyl reductase
MQALRFHAQRDIRLDEIPEPEAGPGQVKVQVEAAGICGSDIHEYVGGPISVPVEAPHPMTGETAPVVFGHEFSGTVVAVGDGVERVEVGQRVAANAALWCGTCPACQQGWTNICRTIGFHGVTGGGGAFAAFDVIDERNAHVLPNTLSPGVGAVLEPLATGIHAVALSGLVAGETALILGAGPIGLMLTQACVAAGVTSIIVAEPSASRRRTATALGATTVVDPIADDTVSVVNDLTHGDGVAAAFDAAAARTSLDTAVAATRARGVVVNVAAWERPVDFNPTTLLFREATVRGSLAYTSSDFDAAIEYAAANTSALESMITRTIPLKHIVTEGFDKLAFGQHDDIKVMVLPQDAPA